MSSLSVSNDAPKKPASSLISVDTPHADAAETKDSFDSDNGGTLQLSAHSAIAPHPLAAPSSPVSMREMPLIPGFIPCGLIEAEPVGGQAASIAREARAAAVAVYGRDLSARGDITAANATFYAYKLSELTGYLIRLANLAKSQPDEAFFALAALADLAGESKGLREDIFTAFGRDVAAISGLLSQPKLAGQALRLLANLTFDAGHLRDEIAKKVTAQEVMQAVLPEDDQAQNAALFLWGSFCEESVEKAQELYAALGNNFNDLAAAAWKPATGHFALRLLSLLVVHNDELRAAVDAVIAPNWQALEFRLRTPATQNMALGLILSVVRYAGVDPKLAFKKVLADHFDTVVKAAVSNQRMAADAMDYLVRLGSDERTDSTGPLSLMLMQREKSGGIYDKAMAYLLAAARDSLKAPLAVKIMGTLNYSKMAALSLKQEICAGLLDDLLQQDNITPNNAAALINHAEDQFETADLLSRDVLGAFLSHIDGLLEQLADATRRNRASAWLRSFLGKDTKVSRLVMGVVDRRLASLVQPMLAADAPRELSEVFFRVVLEYPTPEQFTLNEKCQRIMQLFPEQLPLVLTRALDNRSTRETDFFYEILKADNCPSAFRNAIFTACWNEQALTQLLDITSRSGLGARISVYLLLVTAMQLGRPSSAVKTRICAAIRPSLREIAGSVEGYSWDRGAATDLLRAAHKVSALKQHVRDALGEERAGRYFDAGCIVS